MTARRSAGAAVPLLALALALALAPGPAARAAPDGRSAGSAGAHAQAGADARAQAGADARVPAGADAPEHAASAGQAAPAHERRSPGKPTAPISIDHEWLEPPALGRGLRLRISISSSRALGDVTIRLAGGDGLVVDAASAETRAGALAADETHTFEPAVLAATPGRHYLAVSVTAVIDGAAQTRSVAIPVRLDGDGAASDESPAGEAGDRAKDTDRVRSLPAEQAGNETGRVHSLPAQERVGPR